MGAYSMKSKKKSRKKILIAIVAAVLVLALVLTAVNLGGQRQRMVQTSGGEIRSAQVTTGSVSNSVSGSGTLTSAEDQSVTVPEGITIETVAVEAGDQVKAGDLLATADQESVLTALAEAQEQLDKLDEQLEETEEDTPSSTIQAGVAGRVKAIWAEEGDSVSAVTAEQGGLLLLSLDGCMSVTLDPSDAVEVGNSVTVTLSDGSTEEGTVESQTDSALTITLTDNGPAYGDTVTVTTEDGTELGSGTLAVHSPLLITGYTGTVASVKVEENEKVSSGTTLFRLEDLGHTAEYDALLAQRQTLAERIQTLTALYQDNRITAPFDGTIQSVEVEADSASSSQGQSEEMAYPTAASNATPSGGVTLLSAVPAETEDGQQTDSSDTEDTEDVEPPTDSQTPEDSTQQPETPDSDTDSSDEAEEPDPSDALAPATLTLEAQVTLDGGQMGAYSGAFRLYLSGEGSTQEQTNDATGKVTFDPLTFDAAGSYVYRLYQGTGEDTQITYDTTLYTLTINVTQQGDTLQAQLVSDQSQLVFANQLAAQETPSEDETRPQSQTGSGGSSSGGMSGSVVTRTDSTATSTDADSETGTSSGTDTETDDVTLLTISPDDTMTVSVSVDELDILSIQKGQEAAVTVDALGEEPLTGTVTGMDTSGSSSGGVTKYTVEVTLEKTEQMLANMSASVEITIEQTEDGLLIPEAALQQEGTTTYVYTTYDQETGTLGGETEVTTGISDGTNVQITQGLDEGDTVYYRYAEAVDTGGDTPSLEMGDMGMAGMGRENFSGGAPGGRGEMPGGQF